ncbi:MAG: hypothetical protein K2W80_15140 [Burkholderiales bacterium]|nr:hypothetical protein [Burkholderiales bacterium]
MSGNTSDYLRELIRHDQKKRAVKRLRQRTNEGVRSGRAVRARLRSLPD